MANLIKICGLRTGPALEAALAAGADLVGFVRFPASPRHVELDMARALSAAARGQAARVLLVVDPDDRDLDAALAAIGPDVIQLHGSESPERVAAIRTRTGLPVMKALPIGEAADLAPIADYRGVAERILLDARPPRGAVLPGGNGAAFDWTLLRGLDRVAGLDPTRDIMLSGGLSPATVADAIRTTGLSAVDVSSGVESRPGVKDPDRIRAFVEEARAAFADGLQDRRRA